MNTANAIVVPTRIYGLLGRKDANGDTSYRSRGFPIPDIGNTCTPLMYSNNPHDIPVEYISVRRGTRRVDGLPFNCVMFAQESLTYSYAQFFTYMYLQWHLPCLVAKYGDTVAGSERFVSVMNRLVDLAEDLTLLSHGRPSEKYGTDRRFGDAGLDPAYMDIAIGLLRNQHVNTKAVIGVPPSVVALGRHPNRLVVLGLPAYPKAGAKTTNRISIGLLSAYVGDLLFIDRMVAYPMGFSLDPNIRGDIANGAVVTPASMVQSTFTEFRSVNKDIPRNAANSCFIGSFFGWAPEAYYTLKASFDIAKYQFPTITARDVINLAATPHAVNSGPGAGTLVAGASLLSNLEGHITNLRDGTNGIDPFGGTPPGTGVLDLRRADNFDSEYTELSMAGNLNGMYAYIARLFAAMLTFIQPIDPLVSVQIFREMVSIQDEFEILYGHLLDGKSVASSSKIDTDDSPEYNTFRTAINRLVDMVGNNGSVHELDKLRSDIQFIGRQSHNVMNSIDLDKRLYEMTPSYATELKNVNVALRSLTDDAISKAIHKESDDPNDMASRSSITDPNTVRMLPDVRSSVLDASKPGNIVDSMMSNSFDRLDRTDDDIDTLLFREITRVNNVAAITRMTEESLRRKATMEFVKRKHRGFVVTLDMSKFFTGATPGIPNIPLVGGTHGHLSADDDTMNRFGIRPGESIVVTSVGPLGGADNYEHVYAFTRNYDGLPPLKTELDMVNGFPMSMFGSVSYLNTRTNLIRQPGTAPVMDVNQDMSLRGGGTEFTKYAREIKTEFQHESCKFAYALDIMGKVNDDSDKLMEHHRNNKNIVIDDQLYEKTMKSIKQHEYALKSFMGEYMALMRSVNTTIKTAAASLESIRDARTKIFDVTQEIVRYMYYLISSGANTDGDIHDYIQQPDIATALSQFGVDIVINAMASAREFSVAERRVDSVDRITTLTRTRRELGLFTASTMTVFLLLIRDRANKITPTTAMNLITTLLFISSSNERVNSTDNRLLLGRVHSLTETIVNLRSNISGVILDNTTKLNRIFREYDSIVKSIRSTVNTIMDSTQHIVKSMQNTAATVCSMTEIIKNTDTVLDLYESTYYDVPAVTRTLNDLAIAISMLDSDKVHLAKGSLFKFVKLVKKHKFHIDKIAHAFDNVNKLVSFTPLYRDKIAGSISIKAKTIDTIKDACDMLLDIDLYLNIPNNNATGPSSYCMSDRKCDPTGKRFTGLAFILAYMIDNVPFDSISNAFLLFGLNNIVGRAGQIAYMTLQSGVGIMIPNGSQPTNGDGTTSNVDVWICDKYCYFMDRIATYNEGLPNNTPYTAKTYYPSDIFFQITGGMHVFDAAEIFAYRMMSSYRGTFHHDYKKYFGFNRAEEICASIYNPHMKSAPNIHPVVMYGLTLGLFAIMSCHHRLPRAVNGAVDGAIAWTNISLTLRDATRNDIRDVGADIAYYTANLKSDLSWFNRGRCDLSTAEWRALIRFFDELKLSDLEKVSVFNERASRMRGDFVPDAVGSMEEGPTFDVSSGFSTLVGGIKSELLAAVDTASLGYNDASNRLLNRILSLNVVLCRSPGPMWSYGLMTGNPISPFARQWQSIREFHRPNTVFSWTRQNESWFNGMKISTWFRRKSYKRDVTRTFRDKQNGAIGYPTYIGVSEVNRRLQNELGMGLYPAEFEGSDRIADMHLFAPKYISMSKNLRTSGAITSSKTLMMSINKMLSHQSAEFNFGESVVDMLNDVSKFCNIAPGAYVSFAGVPTTDAAVDPSRRPVPTIPICVEIPNRRGFNIFRNGKLTDSPARDVRTPTKIAVPDMDILMEVMAPVLTVVPPAMPNGDLEDHFSKIRLTYNGATTHINNVMANYTKAIDQFISNASIKMDSIQAYLNTGRKLYSSCSVISKDSADIPPSCYTCARVTGSPDLTAIANGATSMMPIAHIFNMRGLRGARLCGWFLDGMNDLVDPVNGCYGGAIGELWMTHVSQMGGNGLFRKRAMIGIPALHDYSKSAIDTHTRDGNDGIGIYYWFSTAMMYASHYICNPFNVGDAHMDNTDVYYDLVNNTAVPQPRVDHMAGISVKIARGLPAVLPLPAPFYIRTVVSIPYYNNSNTVWTAMSNVTRDVADRVAHLTVPNPVGTASWGLGNVIASTIVNMHDINPAGGIGATRISKIGTGAGVGLTDWTANVVPSLYTELFAANDRALERAIPDKVFGDMKRRCDMIIAIKNCIDKFMHMNLDLINLKNNAANLANPSVYVEFWNNHEPGVRALSQALIVAGIDPSSMLYDVTTSFIARDIANLSLFHTTHCQWEHVVTDATLYNHDQKVLICDDMFRALSTYICSSVSTLVGVLSNLIASLSLLLHTTLPGAQPTIRIPSSNPRNSDVSNLVSNINNRDTDVTQLNADAAKLQTIVNDDESGTAVKKMYKLADDTGSLKETFVDMHTFIPYIITDTPSLKNSYFQASDVNKYLTERSNFSAMVALTAELRRSMCSALGATGRSDYHVGVVFCNMLEPYDPGNWTDVTNPDTRRDISFLVRGVFSEWIRPAAGNMLQVLLRYGSLAGQKQHATAFINKGNNISTELLNTFGFTHSTVIPDGVCSDDYMNKYISTLDNNATLKFIDSDDEKNPEFMTTHCKADILDRSNILQYILELAYVVKKDMQQQTIYSALSELESATESYEQQVPAKDREKYANMEKYKRIVTGTEDLDIENPPIKTGDIDKQIAADKVAVADIPRVKRGLIIRNLTGLIEKYTRQTAKVDPDNRIYKDMVRAQERYDSERYRLYGSIEKYLIGLLYLTVLGPMFNSIKESFDETSKYFHTDNSAMFGAAAMSYGMTVMEYTKPKRKPDATMKHLLHDAQNVVAFVTRGANIEEINRVIARNYKTSVDAGTIENKSVTTLDLQKMHVPTSDVSSVSNVSVFDELERTKQNFMALGKLVGADNIVVTEGYNENVKKCISSQEKAIKSRVLISSEYDKIMERFKYISLFLSDIVTETCTTLIESNINTRGILTKKHIDGIRRNFADYKTDMESIIRRKTIENASAVEKYSTASRQMTMYKLLNDVAGRASAGGDIRGDRKVYISMSYGTMEYLLDSVKRILGVLSTTSVDKMNPLQIYFYQNHYMTLKRCESVLTYLFKYGLDKQFEYLENVRKGLALPGARFAPLASRLVLRRLPDYIYRTFTMLNDILDPVTEYVSILSPPVTIELCINDYAGETDPTDISKHTHAEAFYRGLTHKLDYDPYHPNYEKYKDNLIFTNGKTLSTKNTLSINLDAIVKPDGTTVNRDEIEGKYSEIYTAVTRTSGINFNRIYNATTHPDQSVMSKYMSIGSDLTSGKGIALLTYGYSGSGKTYTIFGKRSTGVRGMLSSTFDNLPTGTEVLFRVYEIYGTGFPYDFYWNKKRHATDMSAAIGGAAPPVEEYDGHGANQYLFFYQIDNTIDDKLTVTGKCNFLSKRHHINAYITDFVNLGTNNRISLIDHRVDPNILVASAEDGLKGALPGAPLSYPYNGDDTRLGVAPFVTHFVMDRPDVAVGPNRYGIAYPAAAFAPRPGLNDIPYPPTTRWNGSSYTTLRTDAQKKCIDEVVGAVDQLRKKGTKMPAVSGTGLTNYNVRRIKPTTNNPESSRSIMVYDFQIRLRIPGGTGNDFKNVPFVIFDFPGKEDILKSYVDTTVPFADLQTDAVTLEEIKEEIPQLQRMNIGYVKPTKASLAVHPLKLGIGRSDTWRDVHTVLRKYSFSQDTFTRLCNAIFGVEYRFLAALRPERMGISAVNNELYLSLPQPRRIYSLFNHNANTVGSGEHTAIIAAGALQNQRTITFPPRNGAPFVFANGSIPGAPAVMDSGSAAIPPLFVAAGLTYVPANDPGVAAGQQAGNPFVSLPDRGQSIVDWMRHIPPTPANDRSMPAFEFRLSTLLEMKYTWFARLFPDYGEGFGELLQDGYASPELIDNDDLFPVFEQFVINSIGTSLARDGNITDIDQRIAAFENSVMPIVSAAIISVLIEQGYVDIISDIIKQLSGSAAWTQDNIHLFFEAVYINENVAGTLFNMLDVLRKNGFNANRGDIPPAGNELLNTATSNVTVSLQVANISYSLGCDTDDRKDTVMPCLADTTMEYPQFGETVLRIDTQDKQIKARSDAVRGALETSGAIQHIPGKHLYISNNENAKYRRLSAVERIKSYFETVVRYVPHRIFRNGTINYSAALASYKIAHPTNDNMVADTRRLTNEPLISDIFRPYGEFFDIYHVLYLVTNNSKLKKSEEQVNLMNSTMPFIKVISNSLSQR